MRVFPGFEGPMASWPHLELVPHVLETLSALYPDWTLALATNATDSSEEDIRSVFRKVGLDDLIDRAQVATGEGRRSIWQAVFKRIHEEIIPDVMLFHMMGYCRVGNKINFQPTMATNNEIPLAEMTFK